MLRSFWNAYDTKDFINGKKFIGTPNIWRSDLGAKKPRGNDRN